MQPSVCCNDNYRCPESTLAPTDFTSALDILEIASQTQPSAYLSDNQMSLK